MSEEKGLNHWKNAIVSGRISLQTVLKSIEKEETFLIFDNDAAVGTITIGKNVPKYYSSDPFVFWQKKRPAVYLKKLAVLPLYQNKGFASELLEFAEAKAKKENVKFLRLDCVANVDFYSKRGFTFLGKSTSKRGTPINFMEKQIV